MRTSDSYPVQLTVPSDVVETNDAAPDGAGAESVTAR